MKKPLVRMLSIVMILTLFVVCIPTALAAGSTAPVQATYAVFTKNSYTNAVSVTIWNRNNSGKTIKYIDWKLVAYNRVGDPVKSPLGEEVVTATSVGPIEPYVWSWDLPDGSRHILHCEGDTITNEPIYIDRENQCAYINSGNDRYYLTDDELNYAATNYYTELGPLWYSPLIESVDLVGAVVTFMDGTTATVSQEDLFVDGKYAYRQTLPYYASLNMLSPVYNYDDYVQYNQDLVAVFGQSRPKYLNHFIKSGVDEGRQGSSQFNLAAYKANNPDLVAQFGDVNYQYYWHYIQTGKAEGRKST